MYVKSGSSGIIIKNRVNYTEYIRVDQFYINSTSILAANLVPELYVGMEDRILPIEFTSAIKNPDESAIKQFEHLLN